MHLDRSSFGRDQIIKLVQDLFIRDLRRNSNDNWHASLHAQKDRSGTEKPY